MSVINAETKGITVINADTKFQGCINHLPLDGDILMVPGNCSNGRASFLHLIQPLEVQPEVSMLSLNNGNHQELG